MCELHTIPNNANDSHRWALDDGNSLDNFLLVCLGTNTIHFAHDVGHAGLVALERSHVDWCRLWVHILRKGAGHGVFSTAI